MSSLSKTIFLAAGLAASFALSAGAPALAQSTHHRGVKHRHHVAHLRTTPLVGGVHVGDGEEAGVYGPRYRNGADDDLSTDGSAIGREGDLVPRDGAPKGYRGPGLELEGPPVYSSLPVVPELYDPTLR